MVTSKRMSGWTNCMNGRDMLLVLTHLFRKKGNEVTIDDAINFLSFQCRYGIPTNVRRLFSLALENEMISREDNRIIAEFLFNKQMLPLNLSSALQDKVKFNDEIEPMY